MENMEGVENFLTRMNADIKAIKTDAEQSALFTGVWASVSEDWRQSDAGPGKRPAFLHLFSGKACASA